MAEHSAGLLLYRRGGTTQVLIAHMGGPFWARRQEHAWSIPKGVIEPGEQPLDAARREFLEELGVPAPEVAYRLLDDVRSGSGKTVTVFAAEGEIDLDAVAFGDFELEWPPRSGRRQSFPEVDRVDWVPLDEARRLLVAGQLPALDALERLLGEASGEA